MKKELTSKYGIRLLIDDKVATENVEVSPDHPENITPSNIRKGVVIFGETGTYEGVNTSDDTVTADKVLYPYTAHDASGSKITGSIQPRTGWTVTANGSVYTTNQYLTSNIEVNIPVYLGESEDIHRIITFIVVDEELTAEQGMTWAEWCPSSYNTSRDSIYIEGNTVRGVGQPFLSVNWEYYVRPTDVIDPSLRYVWSA